MIKKTNNDQPDDPHYHREAEKYAHPVPSREFILNTLQQLGRPVTRRHFERHFALKTEEEREGLRRRLRAMERDGQVFFNRRGRYGLVENLELIKGRVQGHRDGFGFLIVEAGEDIFLPAREMRKCLSNDRVLVRVNQPSRGRTEGVIVEVLERNTEQIVGRFFKEGAVGFISPDDKSMTQDVLVGAEDEGGAKHGQFVVAKITQQPTERRQAQACVIQILGDHLTPGMEVELAIRSHDVPFEWPSAVLAEAREFPDKVDTKACASRLDLRSQPFVTIDGEDARDFDDAVFCEKTKKGWTLCVAIADVSHYVEPDTALDEEAKNRGNSVYFPSEVIPMLPEALSNELCSLKPNVDRFALVCRMQLDEKGQVKQYQFSEAVICSHARLTYTQVADMLAGKFELGEHIAPHVTNLYKLYKHLAKKRQDRGAIEFETTETKIIFDAGGKIDRVEPAARNDAHRIIEEMMLLANVCAADQLLKSPCPALYRNHEPPKADKLVALRDFLKAFGLRLAGKKSPAPKDFAKLLARVQKRPDAHLIQTVMLRSLKQANYAPKNMGHFGLSYPAYTHFTSPIRRYPDLIVHRALKHAVLIRDAQGKRFAYPYDEETMQTLGEHCSQTERRADLATRDATDWLKCDYMQDKLGACYTARIVEVTGFGLFVELDEIYVQGLVHVTSLKNDYYHHDATHHKLMGKRTGKTYRLGDTLRVCVANVNLDERKIDFTLER